MKQTGVALSPKAGFDSSGEGYVHFALVKPIDILADAVNKIALYLKTCSVYSVISLLYYLNINIKSII